MQAVTASVYGAGWQDVLTHLARELGAEASPQEHDGYLGEAADPAAFDAALGEYRSAEASLVAATMTREGSARRCRSSASSMRPSTTSGTPSPCPTALAAGCGRSWSGPTIPRASAGCGSAT
ncbi:hypothetical protein [Streptomyces sp. L7]|uniref:hypothetical protein n=1 Tax=Streptomyces sp. L7 TaxID=3423954 RepID=UPI003D97204A